MPKTKYFWKLIFIHINFSSRRSEAKQNVQAEKTTIFPLLTESSKYA